MIKEDVSPPFHWSGLTPYKGMFCTLSVEGGCSSLKLFSSAFGKGGKKRDVFNFLFAKNLPSAEAKTIPLEPKKSAKGCLAAPPTGGELLPDKPPVLLYWLF